MVLLWYCPNQTVIPIYKWNQHFTVVFIIILRWYTQIKMFSDQSMCPRAAIKIVTNLVSWKKIFFTILGARRPKSRCQQDHCHFVCSRGEYFLASSSFWWLSVFRDYAYTNPCLWGLIASSFSLHVLFHGLPKITCHSLQGTSG